MTGRAGKAATAGSDQLVALLYSHCPLNKASHIIILILQLFWKQYVIYSNSILYTSAWVHGIALDLHEMFEVQVAVIVCQ